MRSSRHILRLASDRFSLPDAAGGFDLFNVGGGKRNSTGRVAHVHGNGADLLGVALAVSRELHVSADGNHKSVHGVANAVLCGLDSLTTPPGRLSISARSNAASGVVASSPE